MANDIGLESKEAILEVQTKQVVSLKIANVSIKDIATQLKLSQYAVRNIIDSDLFRLQLRDLSDRLVDTAANTWKASISELVVEAKRVLKDKLAENDLEAVKIVVRSLGVEKQESVVQQGNIQVILPDYTQAKTITVEPEDV